MTKSELFLKVQNTILQQSKNLNSSDIREDVSLVDQLGLDSLHLSNLVHALKGQGLDIDYTPWFIHASRRGQDTVGGLVDFLFENSSQDPGQR